MANRLLVEANYNVNWQSYFMEHSVLPEQLKDIATWLKARLLA
jgi:phospholipase/carboxylesterase